VSISFSFSLRPAHREVAEAPLPTFPNDDLGRLPSFPSSPPSSLGPSPPAHPTGAGEGGEHEEEEEEEDLGASQGEK